MSKAMKQQDVELHLALTQINSTKYLNYKRGRRNCKYMCRQAGQTTQCSALTRMDPD